MASPAPANPQDAQVVFMKMLLPLPPNAARDDVERVAADARKIISQVSKCEDLRTLAQRTPGATVSQTKTLRVGDLLPVIVELVTTMPIGRAFGPFAVSSAAQILAICSREEFAGPDR
jgi:hypothetical protein